jgi:hypothetical protein
MRKAGKKKQRLTPDLRRIRPTMTYSVEEIAEVTGKCPATVLRWIAAGLPIMEDRRPYLVEGSVLIAWLAERRKSRRHKCGPNELFCFRCRAPRRPVQGSVTSAPRDSKTVTIRAKCNVCGLDMVQAASVQKAAERLAGLGAFTPATTDLLGSGNPVANVEKNPPRKRVSAAASPPAQMDLFKSPCVQAADGVELLTTNPREKSS